MKRKSFFTDLSNDLLIEIFDYIDVLHLFQAFYHLNQRLNLLIIHRHISFQSNMIHLQSKEFSFYKNFILPKIGCYIRYLSISDELNYLAIILRSIKLNNLISVRLYDVKLNELKILLSSCQLKYLFIDTNHIQNEKDLNDIFHILFNQQLNLYAIECHFHTNLYFIEQKYKLSQIKHLILNCECLSSDFLVLICQLPKLRHISARINDSNRESMPKDIDHLIGNQSIRSIILHIENIEFDRLLLILSLIPNVRLVEFNGSIDFDINYILELERNYTSFRYMYSKFVILIILYLFGLILFLNGFLLTRRVILEYSNSSIPLTKPNEFNQIILIVIDALRYDFIKPEDLSIKTNYQNQMPFVRHLLETQSEQSVLLKLIADPPTTTLQRLKALTTGTLPTFIDLSYNFIGYEIEEDNILYQLKKNSFDKRNVSLLGDDTWLALYPNIDFQYLYVYPSFDVHDLDTVDNGILQHLSNVIQNTQQSSFVIAHFLGVDHCGHRYGPSHIEMKRKLNQMDDVIRNLTLSFSQSNSSSLLIVIGDHGMTQQGDHGGDELNEIETALFIYTNKPNYFSSYKNRDNDFVSQIDLVPTLSWYLHSLIPFSNIGMMIIDLIPIEQRYIAMKYNFEQMEIYLKYISLTIPLSDQLEELRANLYTIFHSFDRQRNLTSIEYLFKQYKSQLQKHFRQQWSTFNIPRILLGLIIMFISCFILILTYVSFSQKFVFNILIVLMYFAISFSNSFIINEGMCLYFLIQTIVLTMKMNIKQKILISFLLLCTRAFLICREEQQPYCVDPQWLLAKSSDTSNFILPCLSSILWLIIFISTSSSTYFLPYLSYLSVIGYWFNIPHTLSIFYLSIILQICYVLFRPSRFDTLIYSILIFVVGYRFAPVIFFQYLIYYLLFNNSNTNPSFALLFSLLSDYFFYATGHQPVLSQIRWTAAFPTLNSPLDKSLSIIINSLFVRGLLMIIETYSSQILNIIFIRKQDIQKKLLNSVLIIDCCKLFFTSLSVFILRRHLMLWKIFSPRFLFQLIGIFIKFLVVCLTIKLKK